MGHGVSLKEVIEVKENKQLKEHVLSEIVEMKVHGRTTGNLAPLSLFWTGSAIEFNAKGSELWIEVEVDYDQYEPWVSILINAVPVSRRMLTIGRYWVCVFRGMNDQVVKNVRIVKDVQAMSGDPNCSMQIHAVKFDGEFVPVAEKAYKLEFIGDSITSGEGTIGAQAEDDWIPMWFSSINNYTAMTAEALNAEYRVISQSGWGVLTGWDNNPHANIPEYYEQVCGLLTGEKNKALGALGAHNFASWQPDVVIVNLGTNDNGAFYSPEWTDEASGVSHKQRLNEDGTYNEVDLQSFEKAVERFLIKLRRNNKHAHIIWAYGMLGIPMMPAINRAVQAYTRTTGDQEVSVFQLPAMMEETVGARSHPGALAHEKAAKQLTGYIKGLLNN
jgi:lysophospholipase L1-like esterase